MAVSHWLLAPALLLLPFVAYVSAQQGCSVNNTQPSVNENNPSGYVVTTVHLESGFSVTIDPNSPDYGFFTLQGSELQLTQSVDYEKNTLLIVYLICHYPDGETDSLQILVTIVNVNDNSPVFQETNITQAVPEDTKVNATIIARESLSATDGDLDVIYYELTTVVPDTEGYFAIRGLNNPELYLQKALNYEKFNWTMLLLYGRDRPAGSNDTNTATATINIFIEQADTRPPWFLPCSFINTDKSICISSPYTGRVTIFEMSTEPLTLQPGPVYAVDPDYTLNEKIVYSIVGGDTDNVFSVDADTGNLTMNKAVASADSFLLQVMATQVNNIQKYSVATVEILVINKSNYTPYFESKIYNGMVSVGLNPGSFVYQADHPSSPLMITAVDDDFPDKINPDIEYYIKNSTDFTTTRDGFILTSVTLQTPQTVTIEAVGKDTVTLEETSTVIVVVVHATAVTPSAKAHTVQDMAALGGTLSALLLLALVFLGVMIYKQHRKPGKSLLGEKDETLRSIDFTDYNRSSEYRAQMNTNSPSPREISRGYSNESYEQDEHPDVSTKQPEMSENRSVQSTPPVLEQPVPSFPSSNAQETGSLSKASIASTTISDHSPPEASIASTITYDQEENEEGQAEETKQEKEVKSILKTDRQVSDDGYKAVWFKTDVDPEAGETVEVIENNVSDGDNDSDQDLQNREEEEEDYDKDDHYV